MYLVFSFCPIRFILYTSLCPKRLTFTVPSTTSFSGWACFGLGIGKHSRGLESRKRMRSEYLFSWPPPARLWLENGCIPAGQLFPKATFLQVPKTVLLFYLSRPKDDKHRSWVLYHLLLNILSFSHHCKCFHSSSSIASQRISSVSCQDPGIHNLSTIEFLQVLDTKTTGKKKKNED